MIPFSKTEPPKNAEFMLRFATLDKLNIDLRKELDDALECVEQYLKAGGTKTRHLQNNTKSDGPASSTQSQHEKPTSSGCVSSSSKSVTNSAVSHSDSEDDCIIVDEVPFKNRSKNLPKTEPAREPIKLVINTKTNIVKTKEPQKELKKMNYNDILANDPELRDCVQVCFCFLLFFLFS